MIFKNKKLQSLISSILIIAVLVPSLIAFTAPKKAEAGWPVFDWLGGALKVVGNLFANSTAVSSGTTASYAIKDWAQLILKLALQAIAQKALQEITRSTVNWINGGFHGSPLFLENSGSFFKDIVKSEVKTTIDQYGYDRRKFPFGKDFALNTINSYRSSSNPTSNTQYTLSTVITDPTVLSNFQNNFNVGGWNGFLINTQYPQNNYLGFQMLANEQLAQKIANPVQNKVGQYQQMIQQGQGFLSPQVCPTNPNYNNLANEFQRPVFDEVQFNKDNPAPDVMGGTQADIDAWNAKHDAEKAKWAKDNTCPGGYKATTPGSVVGASITKALGASQDQTTLAGQAGNALSTILGAVLDHFLDKGLSALASKTNQPPSQDTWTYGTQSLDGTGGAQSSPFNGFDEVVVLKDFKKSLNGYFIGKCTMPVANFSDTPVVQKDMKEADCKKAGGGWSQNPTGTDYIPGDIANTGTEIHLMDCSPGDTSCSSLGIIQRIGEIWGKTKTLDQCIPGPDKGWEARLKLEQDRVSKPLQNEAGGGNDPDHIDALKVKAANDALRELKFAVDAFKDWINTKMIMALPGSILYMDEVSKIDDFTQQIKETTNARRAKSSTLARLEAIKQSLNAITTLDSTGEPTNPTDIQTLIALKKQYNAIKADISSTISV